MLMAFLNWVYVTGERRRARKELDSTQEALYGSYAIDYTNMVRDRQSPDYWG